MRKRIILAIFLVIIFLFVLHFTDGTYKPFVKLTAQDIQEITVTIDKHEPVTYTDLEAHQSCAALLQQIELKFSADAQSEPLAVIEITFSTQMQTTLAVYKNSLAIDEKIYALTQSQVQTLLKGIAEID